MWLTGKFPTKERLYTNLLVWDILYSWLITEIPHLEPASLAELRSRWRPRAISEERRFLHVDLRIPGDHGSACQSRSQSSVAGQAGVDDLSTCFNSTSCSFTLQWQYLVVLFSQQVVSVSPSCDLDGAVRCGLREIGAIAVSAVWP